MRVATARPGGRGARSRPSRPTTCAYVIYTSGSTGKPKGVRVPHRARGELPRRHARPRPASPPTTRCSRSPRSRSTSRCSSCSCRSPSARGSSSPAASRPTRRRGAARRCSTTAGATVMQATPATWRMLLEAGWRGGRRSRRCAAARRCRASWPRRCSSARGELWNMYGPTETTVWSTCSRVERRAGRDHRSAGPSPTRSVYVLDERGEPVPHRRARRAVIGGDGVALGYLERPELTAERFVPDRVRARAGARRCTAPATSARWRSDGARVPRPHRLPGQGARLPHRARRDRGALARHPAVAQAVVVARPGPAARTPGRATWSRAPGAGRQPPRCAITCARAARLHGAGGLRDAGRPAADAQRQGRSPRAARPPAAPRPRPRATRRRPPRPSCPVAAVWRELLGVARIARRQLLRPRRPLAAGHPGGRHARGPHRHAGRVRAPSSSRRSRRSPPNAMPWRRRRRHPPWRKRNLQRRRPDCSPECSRGWAGASGHDDGEALAQRSAPPLRSSSRTKSSRTK